MVANQAYFTIAWDLGQALINGPYESFETAMEILGEDNLGEDRQGGIIGPLPFKQLIRFGEWMRDTSPRAPGVIVKLRELIALPEGETILINSSRPTTISSAAYRMRPPLRVSVRKESEGVYRVSRK